MRPAYIVITLGAIVIIGGVLFTLGRQMGQRQTLLGASPTPSPTTIALSPDSLPSPNLTTTPSPNTTPQPATNQVYFSHPQRMGNDCSQVFPVRREVTATQNLERAILEELLRGPTSTEQEQGFTSNIPSGARILNLNINAAGIAQVNFDEGLERGVAGSCRVTAIRSEITQTLLQFPNVSSVVISINNRTEDILQP
jgi:spore germination protein GerM